MDYTLCTGCYTGKDGGTGVGLWTLDAETGTLAKRGEYPCDNPSFLAVTDQCIYAVSERPESGAVTAFRREPDGTLSYLNRVDTMGGDMCHVTVWPDGKHLSAANYRSGSLLVRTLNPDGSVGGETAFVQHSGVGFDSADRQEGPHVHATLLSPDGMRLYASDLGLDWLSVYDIGPDGTLTEAEERAQIRTPDGMGPRHFRFTERGKYLYLVAELGSKLLVYASPDGGKSYAQIQSVPTLPPEFTDFNLAADLHFSPDGRFLYISNRGHDSIARFAVDPATGEAEPQGHFPSGGRWPRNFCLTPDGRWLIAANQYSGTLCAYPRDKETGALGKLACRAEAKQVTFVKAF